MSGEHLSLNQRSQLIKETARECGFDACGIARARKLSEQEEEFQTWLEQKRHGDMHYMENHFEKRLDPRKLVPGTKSIISLIYNYYPRNFFPQDAAFKVSRYGLGKDYHFVLKERMQNITEKLQTHLGPFHYRVFTDSAPLLERAWAREAGLGWIGKNTLLINPQKGSFFFLAEILVDFETAYDQPLKTDHCGTCNRCIQACPTGALTDYKINASRCISYLTIENKKDFIPEIFAGKYNQWIFGCDICQEVCPWNKFSLVHHEKEFEPHPHLLEMKQEDWTELSRNDYQELFRKSAVKRTKYSGLKRNIHFLKDSPNPSE